MADETSLIPQQEQKDSLQGVRHLRAVTIAELNARLNDWRGELEQGQIGYAQRASMEAQTPDSQIDVETMARERRIMMNVMGVLANTSTRFETEIVAEMEKLAQWAGQEFTRLEEAIRVSLDSEKDLMELDDIVIEVQKLAPRVIEGSYPADIFKRMAILVLRQLEYSQTGEVLDPADFDEIEGKLLAQIFLYAFETPAQARVLEAGEPTAVVDSNLVSTAEVATPRFVIERDVDPEKYYHIRINGVDVVLTGAKERIEQKIIMLQLLANSSEDNTVSMYDMYLRPLGINPSTLDKAELAVMKKRAEKDFQMALMLSILRRKDLKDKFEIVSSKMPNGTTGYYMISVNDPMAAPVAFVQEITKPNINEEGDAKNASTDGSAILTPAEARIMEEGLILPNRVRVPLQGTEIEKFAQLTIASYLSLIGKNEFLSRENLVELLSIKEKDDEGHEIEIERFNVDDIDRLVNLLKQALQGSGYVMHVDARPISSLTAFKTKRPYQNSTATVYWMEELPKGRKGK